jgi:hypothetical protein
MGVCPYKVYASKQGQVPSNWRKVPGMQLDIEEATKLGAAEGV